MNKKAGLQEKNGHPLWHPCSQMKDYETFQPIEVCSAEGSYLHLKNGKKVIDAISSWWCKSLGHGHPRLKRALLKQLDQFEHVILANTTNDIIMGLSEKLTALTQNLKRVFYASEGSSAVEVALKMSVHARQITGDFQRNQILALQNAYHGETLFALSVSDLGLYRKHYKDILVKTSFIQDVPYVSSTNSDLWSNCINNWMNIETQLNHYKHNLSAIILEPIVQGAGGMLIYSKDFLVRLKAWCVKNNVHLIADEIMTGFGRTGKMFACQHAEIEPDFLCLGKGMTGGFLPMSAVLIDESIYEIFYQDFAQGNSFLHSHTHSGNVLAAAVANEVLTIFEEEQICDQVQSLEKKLVEYMFDVASSTKKIKNIRWIGGLIAADLEVIGKENRLGYRVYRKAVEYGALLRPLGNTIYWLPPLNIQEIDLRQLRDITIQAIKDVA